MIIYQLPNGKIVHLSVDQFLSLSDDDIKYMCENNFGTDIYNPFSLKTSKDNSRDSDDYYHQNDEELDYTEDDEPSEPFDINNLFEE